MHQKRDGAEGTGPAATHGAESTSPAATDGTEPGDAWLTGQAHRPADSGADEPFAGLARCDDSTLIGLIRGWRKQASLAAAAELAAVAELAARRQAEAKAAGEWDSTAIEAADVEIAAALTLTSRAASVLVERATLLRQLPATFGALASGRIDMPKALVIITGLTGQDPALARQIEAQVIGAFPAQTTGRLRAVLHAAVIAADPHGAEKRREAEEQRARIERGPEPGGVTASLTGRNLPVTATVAAWNRITALARQLKADGTPGTLDPAPRPRLPRPAVGPGHQHQHQHGVRQHGAEQHRRRRSRGPLATGPSTQPGPGRRPAGTRPMRYAGRRNARYRHRWCPAAPPARAAPAGVRGRRRPGRYAKRISDRHGESDRPVDHAPPPHPAIWAGSGRSLLTPLVRSPRLPWAPRPSAGASPSPAIMARPSPTAVPRAPQPPELAPAQPPRPARAQPFRQPVLYPALTPHPAPLAGPSP